jgi:hypothetical protein
MVLLCWAVLHYKTPSLIPLYTAGLWVGFCAPAYALTVFGVAILKFYQMVAWSDMYSMYVALAAYLMAFLFYFGDRNWGVFSVSDVFGISTILWMFHFPHVLRMKQSAENDADHAEP